ncbi:MAG TPA: hypothetical protein VMV95_01255 [Bacillota bacterium]|nr:hypothetical protein [Bacillota bacterium]
MKQYTKSEFDSFMKSMKNMDDYLRSKKPDFIFAPVLGSVPLIDVLSIIDRHFPLETVEYPPNSSRFINRGEIIDKWFSNFLDANYIGDRMSIICIDEVISGSSAVKGYKEFRKVLHNFNEKSSLEKKINYEVLGIGEQPKNKKRNHGFSKLVNQKKAKVFETDKIITADNIELNPVRLKLGKINKQGRQTYLPEIDSMIYSQNYLNLLYETANYFGTDPDQVTPANILKIQGSLEKYLG